MDTLRKWGKWCWDNALWFASIGLMLASSGLDGAYMARLMEWEWLGYVLNTVADLAGMLLIYWFGRFRQHPKGSKKYKLALGLLPAEIVAVAYSWLFSWRQLLIVMPPVEGRDTWWMSRLAAGFVPLLLAFIGYAQSIAGGRVDAATEDTIAKAKQEFKKRLAEHDAVAQRKMAVVQTLLKEARLAAEKTEAQTHAEVVAQINDNYDTKEGIILAGELGLFDTQKEIANAFALSSSYVSRCLASVKVEQKDALLLSWQELNKRR